MWPETRTKVQAELDLMHRLIEEYPDLLDTAREGQPDKTELLAMCAVLQSFYFGVENILKRIALDIDGGMPSGGRFHKELLERMAAPFGPRPAVISRELRNRLGEYLGFRHVFRYGYSSGIEWPRMSHLVLGCGETLRLFEAELAAFFGPEDDEK